eukprot:15453190-Alexandrium_andersonii.AAC.1
MHPPADSESRRNRPPGNAHRIQYMGADGWDHIKAQRARTLHAPSPNTSAKETAHSPSTLQAHPI